MTIINILTFGGDIIYSLEVIIDFIFINDIFLKLNDIILENYNLLNGYIILENNSKIILLDIDILNLTLVKLPTRYLYVYKQDQILKKININRMLNITINDFYNQLKEYINEEYCLLSNPEIYIYQHVCIDNSVSVYCKLHNLISLLYDDYNKVLDIDYKIIIINLLSPIYYGALKYITNCKNHYLICKCTQLKYKCVGLITDYYIEKFKFNEHHVFTINNDTTNLLRYEGIQSLYFMKTEEDYNKYKTYFETEINNGKEKINI